MQLPALVPTKEEFVVAEIAKYRKGIIGVVFSLLAIER